MTLSKVMIEALAAMPEKMPSSHRLAAMERNGLVTRNTDAPSRYMLTARGREALRKAAAINRILGNQV